MKVGAESFRLCRELLDGVLLVDNGSISGAIEAVFNDKRSILEPAGAVAVAGAVQYLERNKLEVRSQIFFLAFLPSYCIILGDCCSVMVKYHH